MIRPSNALLLMLKQLISQGLARLIALLYFLLTTLVCLICFSISLCIWLGTFWFDRRLLLLHSFSCIWASIVFHTFPPWKLTLHNRERFDPKKTYVVVSNHQSMLDILLSFLLYRHFKWVSKAEMFRLPLVGWNMTLNRYVSLERGSPASIRKMYASCEKHLREGSSIFMFPEGTRSETGVLQRFRTGAFQLAKRNRVPILPIAIAGSQKALPKHSMNFHGFHHMDMYVLPPISPEDYAEISAAELAGLTRSRIAGQLEAWEQGKKGRPAGLES